MTQLAKLFCACGNRVGSIERLDPVNELVCKLTVRAYRQVAGYASSDGHYTRSGMSTDPTAFLISDPRTGEHLFPSRATAIGATSAPSTGVDSLEIRCRNCGQWSEIVKADVAAALDRYDKKSGGVEIRLRVAQSSQ